jgi:hypothetical protein
MRTTKALLIDYFKHPDKPIRPVTRLRLIGGILKSYLRSKFDKRFRKEAYNNALIKMRRVEEDWTEDDWVFYLQDLCLPKRVIAWMDRRQMAELRAIMAGRGRRGR